METIVDFVTGRTIPLVGSEENRQAVERFLVAEKGYQKTDILVNVPIQVALPEENYESRVDLVVLDDRSQMAMVIKCAAGSLGSRQREALAAARLLTDLPVPITVVSDGRTAEIWDTLSGKMMGMGLDQIPDKTRLSRHMATTPRTALSQAHRYVEAVRFRSYDMMNVNVVR